MKSETYTIISTELPNNRSTRNVTIDITKVDLGDIETNEYEVALYYHKPCNKMVVEQKGLTHEEAIELYNLCIGAVVAEGNEGYLLAEIKSIIELFQEV